MITFISAILFGACAFRAAYWETKADNIYAATKWLYWHLAGMVFLSSITGLALHYALTGPGHLWVGFAVAAGALGYMFGRLFGIMDVIEELDGNPMI